jgi:uncharacterized protein (TIGR02270 family)
MSTVIRGIVAQHAEEAAFLWSQRRFLLRAPHVTLSALRDHDERLDSHLDGLAIAGEDGWHILASSRGDIGPGVIFAAAVLALGARHPSRLEELLTIAETHPETRAELLDGLGWVPADVLAGQVHGLLMSARPLRRGFGIAACGVHGRNPGPAFDAALGDAAADVRALALQAVGESGDVARLAPCLRLLGVEEPECRWLAARAAVLLGQRGIAVDALWTAAMANPFADGVMAALALQAMAMPDAHSHLQQLAHGANRRCLVRASGVAGDITYVPWLINQMRVEPLARAAGEAFTLVTGVDLTASGLTRAVDASTIGPTDDPGDPNVAHEPDDWLPWPDPEKVTDWWAKNSVRFQPGRRYFMGEPVTREHCIEVLKNGYQRQRILAAHYLCLLNPGTPLFNTSAPAWRQQRLLAQMV